MARKHVELSDFYPYHICARSNNRDWFTIPLSTIYDIYAKVLEQTSENYKIKLHSFVLMSNHFHMLISTPQANLSTSMRYFMTESSRAIARTSSRINRIYGARYHWTILRNSEHYAHAFKYVYRNPIKARMTLKVEDYKWSTVNQWHTKMNTIISANENGFDEYISMSKSSLLNWLNNDGGMQYNELVGKALRRHEFKIPQCRTSGKRLTLSDQLHP